MSSTRNSQNLLVNVFRPTYVYDGCGFSAGVVATNLKTIDVPTVRATSITIGDVGGNVYIGTGSGVTYSAALSNTSNTALGLNAASGISNVQRSVFIGANAGIANLNSSNTIIIGADANAFGTKNIIIGNGTFVSGSNNIVIGTDVSLSSSYKFKVGNVFTADISTAALLNVTGVSRFDASVGVFRDPSYNLDVSGNFRVSDASSSLIFSNGTTVGAFITKNGSSDISGYLPIMPLKRGLYTIAATYPLDYTKYVYGFYFVRDNSGDQLPQSSYSSAGGLGLEYQSPAPAGYLSLYGTNGRVDWSIKFQPF